MKLKEGQIVIFEFNGKNQIGIIENIKLINKVKRYQCRAESGKLYSYIGVNTVTPGRINIPLTKAYMEAKAGESVKIKENISLYVQPNTSEND